MIKILIGNNIYCFTAIWKADDEIALYGSIGSEQICIEKYYSYESLKKDFEKIVKAIEKNEPLIKL